MKTKTRAFQKTARTRHGSKNHQKRAFLTEKDVPIAMPDVRYR
jgi:hypothetical protein